MVFIIGISLLVHLFFWGAGMAILGMPRPWKSFWPVLAFPAGAALQSLTVWLAAYAGSRGTSSYAWWAEIIPVLLLGVAWRARGPAVLTRPWRSFLGVGMSVVGSLGALLWPFTKAAREITTFSLGSCDAADYAAGARTLMEFARADRSGFLGLTEVVRVMSVDNFFDFWLRLNHFTPAALIAFNSSLLHLQSYQSTGMVTAVLLAASVPMVFWLARSGLHLRGPASVWISALYGFSPITWYAVYQVAMGQLLAALGIAVITWGGIALWKKPAKTRSREFFPMLLVGYLLVLGSYNFILVVALVPTVTFALGRVLRQQAWRHGWHWLFWLLLPLAAAGLLLAARVAGMAERFLLLGQYDFGWKIPLLTPEGWLGLVAGVNLENYSPYLKAGLLVETTALVLAGFFYAGRKRPLIAWTAVALTVPILGGYYFLQWRGAHFGTNASYDAYKLLAVFFPGILAVSCFWIVGLGSRSARLRGLTVAGAVLVSVGTLISAGRYEKALRTPPLIVTPELAQLQSLEHQPEVASVNMYIPDMWSRLWANDFLLRRPQYFLTHTYEGRLNTPLRGDWDLHGGVIEVQLPGHASVTVNPAFSLTNTRSDRYIRASFGTGWYDLESLPRTSIQWRWAQNRATLDLENPQSHPVDVALTIDARSLLASRFSLSLSGASVGEFRVQTERQVLVAGTWALPVGKSVLTITDLESLPVMQGNDRRALALAAYHLTLRVLP